MTVTFHKSSNKKSQKEKKAFNRFDLIRWFNYNRKIAISEEKEFNKGTDFFVFPSSSVLTLKEYKTWFNKIFDDAVQAYNSLQRRKSRKIINAFQYFETKKNIGLSEYLIVGFGNENNFNKLKNLDIALKNNLLNFWNNLNKELLEILNFFLPNFLVFASVLHVNETSPFLFILGTPIYYQDNKKNGLKKSISSSRLFSKEKMENIRKKLKEFWNKKVIQLREIDCNNDYLKN